MNNKSKGLIGERLAANYLKKGKYEILERNFNFPIGEVDIIARKNDTIVFVEVKSRETCLFGLPSESVNYRKQKKYIAMAKMYMVMKNLSGFNFRFDVIEVLGEEINHIENAFEG